MPLRGLEKYTPGMGPKHPIPRNAIGGEAIWPFHLQYWLNVLAADDDYYINAVALPDAAGTWLATTAAKFNGANTKGAGFPDYARAVTAVCSDTQTGNIVVNGFDIAGHPVSETIALSSGTPVAGKVAFKQIVSIDMPIKVGSETIKVGFSDVLGLDSRMAMHTVFKELQGNSYPVLTVSTAGTFVLASGAANADCYGTYDPNSAANGTIDFAVIYIPSDRM